MPLFVCFVALLDMNNKLAVPGTNSWSLKSLWWMVYQIEHVFYNIKLEIMFFSSSKSAVPFLIIPNGD